MMEAGDENRKTKGEKGIGVVVGKVKVRQIEKGTSHCLCAILQTDAQRE